MYIDSGADMSLLPRQLGEAIGLALARDNTQEVQGIGGRSIPVIMSAVKMRIGRRVIDARIACSLSEDVPLILGRMDVFDSFKVTFDQSRGLVEFQST